ncbi:LLM class oxidoreductase [Nocardioides sp.]|uniref:LLM class oxidoreductase n=1 Tax=Nocardioides sp. TaxID=35761 RepID=UPI002735630B|nr:LLM class oxidoreductase [Nocardioides sp.]MDP3890821.1 LLM class oxidoreductase [Nocardioides sp.]
MFNSAYHDVFAPGRLTLGLFFAIESYAGAVPTMAHQLDLARRADELGFAALWVRDVPLLDLGFGDAGQVYDPYVWLGQVSAVTRRIALGTAGLVLPLRHPLHVAKALASVDTLTRGRMIAGLSTGDRHVEYPLFGRDFEARGESFRQGLLDVRKTLGGGLPGVAPGQGSLPGVQPLPTARYGRIPLLSIGSSQQSLQWLATHADGWVTYPRPLAQQQAVSAAWRAALAEAQGGAFKPFAQSLYIDLVAEPSAERTPVHLGYRLGRDALLRLLDELRSMGVSHVLLNLKYGRRPAAEVVEELGEHVVPSFS